jgi:hypothetical protein
MATVAGKRRRPQNLPDTRHVETIGGVDHNSILIVLDPVRVV